MIVKELTDKMDIETFSKIIKKIKNRRELSKMVDKYLVPLEKEKSDNAEFTTPFKLRQEMLDKIPEEFWKSPKKVFEPCSGKGGFLIDIIDRFMIGLNGYIDDDEERYKFIVEKCLYFCDINSTNIYINKLLIDHENKYKLNFYQGDTLKLDIKDKFNLLNFDAIIGNPPYNPPGCKGIGNSIWQSFTKLSIDKWLKKDGLLLFVHPPGWRKPNSKRSTFYGFFNKMTKDNQMIYLSIHGIKDGKETFNCGTRYDWYLIQKTPKYKNTDVCDVKGEIGDFDMDKFNWLPNSNIKLVEKLIDKPYKLDILYNSNYSRINKKIVSKVETEEFKYPLIYLTPKKGIRKMYSKINNRGHFGISKVIIGESGMDNALLDFEGEYGMTQDSFGIIISNIEEGKNILKVIKTPEFKKFIKESCSWSNFRIDYRLFKDFNNDFWKDFII